MKTLSLKWCLLFVPCFMLFGNATRLVAAEENAGGPDERLQRLERRINQLAERQEQMLRRFGARQEAQERMARRLGAAQEPPGPIAPPGPEGFQDPLPPAAPPAHIAAKALHDLGDLSRLILLVWILCNILLAIWIFSDIRKRGEGSGIFVALALVAGIPAAIIYSLVRIGDRVPVTVK
jgi:hypothetical protein